MMPPYTMSRGDDHEDERMEELKSDAIKEPVSASDVAEALRELHIDPDGLVAEVEVGDEDSPLVLEEPSEEPSEVEIDEQTIQRRSANDRPTVTSREDPDETDEIERLKNSP